MTRAQASREDQGIARRTSPRRGRRLIRWVEQHPWRANLIVVVAVLLAVLWHVDSTFDSMVKETALQHAGLYSDAIAKFRTVYTREVVGRAKSHGVQIRHDYDQHPGAIPLPATLSMILGNEIGRSKSGGSSRLYSDHPFPWRADSSPTDEFARESLRRLRANPNAPHFRFEHSDGERTLRYAIADRMRASCVACHNSHPDSPKTDWREGDVRGVLEVTLPLGAAVASAQASLWQTTLFLILLSLICSSTVVLGLRSSARAARTAEKINRDLESANRDLETAYEEASVGTRTKSEFLANMSHEIRTPLTAILGFADVLQSEMDEDAISDICRDAIHTIASNGEHLVELVNGILDLSKIEAGRMEIELLPVSVHGFVEDVIALLKVTAEGKSLTLDADFADELPETIQTDPTRLRQILVNLVSNGLKFTEVGGVTIRVRCEREGPETSNAAGGTLTLEIEDTGLGLTQDQLSALFRPFTQVDTSMTRRFGGTGLGLSISKRLADLLGGSVEVDSEIGHGSTFTVTVTTGSLAGVPWIDYATHVERSAAECKVKRQSVLEQTGLSRRVLLVEDGKDNQRLISFILRKAGADVTIADNGQIGVERAMDAITEGCPFDVIFMDMQMPIMDGYTATRMLREHGYTRPIIALTAHAMTEQRQACLDAGCDSYASKPIDRAALLEILASHCAAAVPD